MKRLLTLLAISLALALVPVQASQAAKPLSAASCVEQEMDAATDALTHFTENTDAGYVATDTSLGLGLSYAGGTVTVNGDLANTCRGATYAIFVYDAVGTALASDSYVSDGSDTTHAFTATVTESHTSTCVWVEGLATIRSETLDATPRIEVCHETPPGQNMF